MIIYFWDLVLMNYICGKSWREGILKKMIVYIILKDLVKYILVVRGVKIVIMV